MLCYTYIAYLVILVVAIDCAPVELPPLTSLLFVPWMIDD
jgi:hypothetical protein